jgi:hypothetical protein
MIMDGTYIQVTNGDPNTVILYCKFRMRKFCMTEMSKKKSIILSVFTVLSLIVLVSLLIFGTGYFLTRRITQFVPLTKSHNDNFGASMRFQCDRSYYIVMSSSSEAEQKLNFVSSFSTYGGNDSTETVVYLNSINAFSCSWGRNSNPNLSSYAIQIYPAPTAAEAVCKVMLAEHIRHHVKDIWLLETKP